MIRKHDLIKKALCDACGKPLSMTYDFDNGQVHWGALTSHHGYGSDYDCIDQTRTKDLCDECWVKVHRALNIPLNPSEKPQYLRLEWNPHRIDTDEPWDGSTGVEIYHKPTWHCNLCDWSGNSGHSLPDHRHSDK